MADNIHEASKANTVSNMVDRFRKSVDVAEKNYTQDVHRREQQIKFIEVTRQRLLPSEKLDQFLPLTEVTHEDLLMMRQAN